MLGQKKELKEFLLYGIVGGIATVVEWLMYYLLDQMMGIHYLIATAIAYVISTFSNWLAGRLILYKNVEKNMFAEIVSIYLVSVVGLILNGIIMFVMIDLVHIPNMFSKIVATGCVFFWNYLIRKFWIYK